MIILRSFYLSHKQKLGYVGISICALAIWSIGLQLLYPPNLTLPGQKVGNAFMSLKTSNNIKSYLSETQAITNLNIKIDGKTQSISWQQAGITIDKNAVASNVVSYSWKERLVPFSALYKVLSADDKEIVTQIDEKQLSAYSKKLAEANYRDPANASLSISGSKVIRNSQKQGIKYDQNEIIKQIKSTSYADNTTIILSGIEVQPSYTASDIESVAKRAEAIIASSTKVDSNGTAQIVPSAEIASWLKFTGSSNAKGVSIEIDKEKIKTYLSGLNKSVYRAPGTMTITLKDGQEFQRSADTSGQTLDINRGTDLIASNVLENKQTMVVVPILKLAPKITYQRTYTRSQAGLNALINDLVASETDMSIALRALDGSGIVASARGTKQYDPASTYKLPLAYSVIKRVEAGSLQWTDDVNGRNVDKCLRDMIVVSDNPCAKALGDKLGWSTVTSEAQAIGMSRTNLATTNNFVSTSDDQALFLAKLQAGTLTNASNRDHLLDLMKQQIYRLGIPAGTSGSIVADKVGFIGSLLHDSAIVYSPRGTYVLVIYSNKSSWSRISTVTSKINALMNQ